MATLTITEALQEIKTLQARIQKKRGNLGNYISRDSRVRDPFEKEGGSEAYVKKEFQAIQDMEERVIRIRRSIQLSNHGSVSSSSDTSAVTIGNTSRTVADWLTWRREIAQNRKIFLTNIIANIQKWRIDLQAKGGKVLAASVATDPTLAAFQPNAPIEVLVNLDEKALLVELEELETILSTLDGRLSLFNAITQVNVD